MRTLCLLFTMTLMVAGAETVVFHTGDLHGTLVAADGVSPLSEVRVVLLRADGALVAEVETAEDGSFRFGDLEPGTYLVRVGRMQVPLLVRLEPEAGEVFASDLLISLPASWAVAVVEEGQQPLTVELYLAAGGLHLGQVLQADDEWTGTQTAIAYGAGGAVLVGGGTAAALILTNQDSKGSGGPDPVPLSPFRP